MRKGMVSERVILADVVRLAQTTTRSHLVQIGWIVLVMASPELWHVDEVLWGGVQVVFVPVSRLVNFKP